MIKDINDILDNDDLDDVDGAYLGDESVPLSQNPFPAGIDYFKIAREAAKQDKAFEVYVNEDGSYIVKYVTLEEFFNKR